MPKACALTICTLRNREAAEHPGEPAGEPEARIARRQADDHAAVERTVPRVNRPPTRSAPRLSVPGGGSPSLTSSRPFTSPTISTPCANRARERQARRSSRRLCSCPAVGSAACSDPAVADDADRLHRLAEQQRRVEIGGIEPETALVRGDRQLGGEADADRRTTGRLRHQAHLGADDQVLDRRGLVARRSRARMRVGRTARDPSRSKPLVEPAVDLDLGDRRRAEADAERRQPQQVAGEP